MGWVLDGNNLAGGSDRSAVRQAALNLVRRERIRLVLFFDGPPPPGGPAVELLGSLEVRYVGDADRAILEFLRAGGGGWLVASDDRALISQARATGARGVGSQAFWRRAQSGTPTPPRQDSPTVDVGSEVAYFRDPANRLWDGERHVPRRRGKRHQGRR